MSAPVGQAVALVVVVAALSGCTGKPAFQGTSLDPPRAVLDFSLADQHGERVRLNDLRGAVVVLTFLYTSCTDVCPLVAGKLREADRLLGAPGRDIAFVAVTVDPERDTPATVTQYSNRWPAPERWHFLTGTVPELEPIWRYYWVGALRRAARGDAASTADYEVEHAAPVHLIDRAGRIRVAYGSGFRPAELAHDLEILLAE